MQYTRIVLVLAVALAQHSQSSIIKASSGCEIPQTTSGITPLILSHGTNEFIYPEHGETTLKFTAGETIDLACPGGTLSASGLKASTSTVAEAKCVSGTKFEIDSAEVSWASVSCSSKPSDTAQYTGNKCDGGKEAEIGFDLGSGRFVRTILVCFDPTYETAIYSHYNLTASILSRTESPTRPSFKEGSGFYNITKMTQLYTKTNQRNNINYLIGLSETSTKYIQENNYYLAKGHLTARTDFVYGAQLDSTFYYINTAPQWQNFNEGNWEKTENDVRDYADKNIADLQVWTGIYGVTTLPHESTGKAVELYLYVDRDNNNTAVPVPQLFWKVVYNPSTKKGVALIGVNNPYLSSVTDSIICDDVSSSLTWLTWKNDNIEQGYSYACTVASLRKVVTAVPNLGSIGLLT